MPVSSENSVVSLLSLQVSAGGEVGEAEEGGEPNVAAHELQANEDAEERYCKHESMTKRPNPSSSV